jgi:transcriptional regulator GlxA family with amidase domain
MSRPVRIADLAGELAVSERTPIRRFNAVLDQSPLTYLQHLRIESARALLEASDLGVDQIAVQVGYNDPSSFSRLFRERMGVGGAHVPRKSGSRSAASRIRWAEVDARELMAAVRPKALQNGTSVSSMLLGT